MYVYVRIYVWGGGWSKRRSRGEEIGIVKGYRIGVKVVVGGFLQGKRFGDCWGVKGAFCWGLDGRVTW